MACDKTEGHAEREDEEELEQGVTGEDTLGAPAEGYDDRRVEDVHGIGIGGHGPGHSPLAVEISSKDMNAADHHPETEKIVK